MSKRSLILAGGGLKVGYQAGVLQVWLDEAGLSFDHADGASGGCFNLAMYCQGLSGRQIADNCGIDGSVVADEIREKAESYGYDANNGKYTDMFKAGIIDPVKVVRLALKTAASISGLLLTTEALVTNFDKDDKKKQKVEGAVR